MSISESVKNDIILIGGASCVGKSSVSYTISKMLGIGVTEVDDFQVVLEAMTNEKDYPVIHYWNNHFEEAIKLPEKKKVEIMINYANTMSIALEKVIENHLESNRPLLLDGDFITPALSVRKRYGEQLRDDKIKSIFIVETEEEQIQKNLFNREGYYQNDRARTNWLYNEWIKEQADVYPIKIVAARPWDSVINRVCKSLDIQDSLTLTSYNSE
jgi:2-phosphoglycerate kinase